MSLQKTVNITKGNIPITDAYIVINNILIRIDAGDAIVTTHVYLNKEAHDTKPENPADEVRDIIKGDDYMTYIDTSHATKTQKERVEDYLLANRYENASVVE